MQRLKRVKNQRSPAKLILSALAGLLAAMGLSGCQTPQLTPEQWNARTNAVNAFSNAAQNFSNSQRPTYGPSANQPQRIVCNQGQCFLVSQ